MKTLFLKPNQVERRWWLVDAEGQVLGRLASRVAILLRGKHKAGFAPNMEMGDWVVIVNAEKAVLTGRKSRDKLYRRHSGYPGGLKTVTYEKVLVQKPTFPMEQAIRRMLPKGPMGRKLFTNVKIYAGASHPHAAQKPEKIEL
ncbi:MAG: 50S ribosomal protein L13 [Spirochaetales bacterium]|nr:50S ribosomal protein L13 [Spirochaetales bacterium]